jgi:hypothetical protein
MRILTIFSLASFLLIAGLTSASQSALAADGMVVKQSQHSVGKVWIAYNDPAYLALRHNIKDKHKIFKKMSDALKKLTSKAAN